MTKTGLQMREKERERERETEIRGRGLFGPVSLPMQYKSHWLNTLTKSKPPFLKIIPSLIVIILTQSLNYSNKSLKYNSLTA